MLLVPHTHRWWFPGGEKLSFGGICDSRKRGFLRRLRTSRNQHTAVDMVHKLYKVANVVRLLFSNNGEGGD